MADKTDGVTLRRVDEIPPVSYGGQGVKFPYERTSRELNDLANNWKPKKGQTDDDRPWLSVRTGPRKRMDAFVHRLKENLEVSEGWVLEVTTRTLEGQTKIPYGKRETEVFARVIPQED